MSQLSGRVSTTPVPLANSISFNIFNTLFVNHFESRSIVRLATVRRRGFEVLLRKLLAYKHAPALIVLHWWSPRTKHFWQSAQDEMDVFNKCVPCE